MGRLVDCSAKVISIKSSFANKSYRVCLDVPREKPMSKRGYPVVYVLDGNSVSLIALGLWRLQATVENELEPAVVVTVGYETSELFSQADRYADLTPYPSEQTLYYLESETDIKKFGGADDFMNFLELDLKPAVRRQVAVDDSRETIIGHSLGGVFALYVLGRKPDLFTNYVIGSPSLWWNRGLLLDGAGRVSMNKVISSSKRKVLIGVGGVEAKSMIADAEGLFEVLKNNDPEALICFHKFSGEDHISSIAVLLNRAVSFSLCEASCSCK